LSVLVTTTRGFDDADSAARAALAVAMARSREQEHGGAIFERDGRYYYTEPVSSGTREESRYDVAAPAGSRLAAIYHSHPRHEMDECVSATDVATARRLRVRSYIGIVSKGCIRVFDPGNMRGAYLLKRERYGKIGRGALLPEA
jgi:proteasome lid subunit RPN8/RPN11